jgi:hypothetical protein
MEKFLITDGHAAPPSETAPRIHAIISRNNEIMQNKNESDYRPVTEEKRVASLRLQDR